MPLIQYTIGNDVSTTQVKDDVAIQGAAGRMHDLVVITCAQEQINHILDVLDHRVGRI